MQNWVKKYFTVGDIEHENFFYRCKSLIFQKDAFTGKILVSKLPFVEKDYEYLISYLYNDHKVKSLHVMLPKKSAHVKSYDEQTKCIHFLLKMMTY